MEMLSTLFVLLRDMATTPGPIGHVTCAMGKGVSSTESDADGSYESVSTGKD